MVHIIRLLATLLIVPVIVTGATLGYYLERRKIMRALRRP